MSPEHFYAHGKLLLSGEYFVLDGAKALSIPTRYGQHLEIVQIEIPSVPKNMLYWDSLDEKGNKFLEMVIELSEFKVLVSHGDVPHDLLLNTLKVARKMNPEFLKQETSVGTKSWLEFNPAWGLGSSSTLIHNIASWAKVDALELLFSVLDGSGYDVACAGSDKPILYQLDGKRPVWSQVDFNPPFAGQLCFIYLGKKQNSSDAVKKFREAPRDAKVIEQISSITVRMVQASTAAEFRAAMEEHEEVVANATQLQKVKDLYFTDFPGAVKSLGAWGGDFVMALAEDAGFDTRKYFLEKGFETVFRFEEMAFRA